MFYEFPYREEEGIDPDSTLADLARLNNDVTNSADFATIISLDDVSKIGYALAFGGGQLSANPKDVEAIRHELGHNFGGAHSFDNKNYDPRAGYHFGYFHDVHKFGTALGGNNINYYSNPRINHPKFGVPLGRHNTNDVARKITEDRFSLNRGDESRACYTCNAYSGQRLMKLITKSCLILSHTIFKSYTLPIFNTSTLYHSNTATNAM